MGELPTMLSCSGCGCVAPADARHPFRCPNRRDGDDTDHVLKETLSPAPPGLAESFDSDEANPFLKYRTFFHAYHAARSWGLSDGDFTGIVRKLDGAVARVDGHGFVETPFDPAPRLSESLRLGSRTVWVKNETGNVSGSHKARHLMGIMIWLEALRRAFPGERGKTEPALAIASCGNAALAAAVVARAAERPIDVFIPPDANPAVVRRLTELKARLVRCAREGGVPGDPCYLKFKGSIAKGSLPFTVQGNENGLTIAGGKTLAYEMVSRLRSENGALDRIFVHVGGGALASSIIQGLSDLKALGLIDRLPKVYAVQTEGAFPLARAYRKVAERVLSRHKAGPGSSDVLDPVLSGELRYAATHRSSFMWPWETEPKSIAHGILDDETYDWLAVVEGMLRTGGYPVVVSEDDLKRAHRLCCEHTGIPADPTGTAGLAGLLRLLETENVSPHETVAVLFTGVER